MHDYRPSERHANAFQRLMALMITAPYDCFFNGSIHLLDLPIRPRMFDLGKSVIVSYVWHTRSNGVMKAMTVAL